MVPSFHQQLHAMDNPWKHQPQDHIDRNQRSIHFARWKLQTVVCQKEPHGGHILPPCIDCGGSTHNQKL